MPENLVITSVPLEEMEALRRRLCDLMRPQIEAVRGQSNQADEIVAVGAVMVQALFNAVSLALFDTGALQGEDGDYDRAVCAASMAIGQGAGMVVAELGEFAASGFERGMADGGATMRQINQMDEAQGMAS